MNSQQPQHAALEAEERELARVVRALPGGEPPPALDAFILKSAHNAVAAAPGRRQRTGPVLGSVWGISSAAAAVLALGVGWQLLNPTPSSFSVSDGASQAAREAVENEQSTAVDFIHRQPPAAPPPPPLARTSPPLSPALRPTAPGAVSRQMAEQQPLKEAPAKSDSAAFMDEHVAGMAIPAEEGIVATPEPQLGPSQAQGAISRSQRSEAMAKANAPMPAPAAQALASPALSAASKAAGERRVETENPPPVYFAHDAKAELATTDASAGAASDPASMDRIEVTGSRLRADADKQRDGQTTMEIAAERKRVAGDAGLSAGAWLEKVRKRHRDGDPSGARASLLLYLEKNPEAISTLPADLRQLLQE